MHEHLTYLTLKYGDKECNVSILYELPAEIAIDAYRKYYTKHLLNSNIPDDIIINKLASTLENSKPETTFNRLFSSELLSEIKKYYA